MYFNVIFYIVSAIFILNVILAAIVVFFERRNPASTWAWLFVLFFVPVAGFLIYMIFGRNTGKQRIFGRKQKLDEKILFDFIKSNNLLSDEIGKQIFSTDGIELDKNYGHLRDFATLNIRSGSWMTYNNSMRRFTDGKLKFESLINDIDNAKNYVHLEYYIFRNDKLGRRMIYHLTKAAIRGVEVRIIYDLMGNMSLPDYFFTPVIKAGGKVTPFNPPLFIRINYRDHRKIAVIDGQIGYIGGFNIGDEYLGDVKRFGYWRDTHVRFEGDVVDQLQLRFMMDWNFFSNEELKISEFYFPKKPLLGYLPAQIVSSGPDTKWQNVKNGYFKMINEAEKNIYIETPYFSPDEGVLEALKVAALSGIDVRIIIPAHPDHFFVYWSSMSYLGELIEVGVKVYQYTDGFIHSKTIFIDSLVATVGTANMDVRSFGLNFEVNSFIYDEKIVAGLEADFIKDIEDSKRITYEDYKNRGKIFKFRESVARLISPML
ncbi:MAG: cardiolipin synthase [Clostridia bacterium]|nr:cardiolipin synthase [Clostridia bacterium]MCI2015695.1 cardiolipin synthase [Clostridia bacterium]